MLGHSDYTVQAGTPMTVTGKGALSCILGQGVDPDSFTFFCLEISSGVRGWKTPGGFSKRGRLA